MNFNSILGMAMAAGLVFTATDAPVGAADPYFVPYGAHRGRIHIGPRHTRIRWGGGVTPYGAAVLIHGFDVAGAVITGSSGTVAPSGDDNSSVGSESAVECNQAECQEQLRRTRELLEETKRACSLGSPAAAPEASAEPGTDPAAALRDSYSQIVRVKRDVAATLPLIAELEGQVAQRKDAAAAAFTETLARDRQAFEAFINAYKSP